MEQCNGWSNRETWVTNLWITNEQGPAAVLQDIVETPTDTVSERGDMLRDYVEEAFDIPTTGLAADLCGLYRVDWAEIIRAHEDD